MGINPVVCLYERRIKMADIINEITETANEIGMDTQILEPVTVDGPTIFKTSDKAKIVFGVVVLTATAYGLYKGIKCLKNRKDAKKACDDCIDILDDAEDDSDLDEE